MLNVQCSMESYHPRGPHPPKPPHSRPTRPPPPSPPPLPCYLARLYRPRHRPRRLPPKRTEQRHLRNLSPTRAPIPQLHTQALATLCRSSRTLSIHHRVQIRTLPTPPRRLRKSRTPNSIQPGHPRRPPFPL